MKTTNVNAQDLNYDNYSTVKYDRDIINSIPFHKELHEKIIKFIRKYYFSQNSYSILDLGAGTGITSKLIKNELAEANIDLVDFSKKMLAGAKKKFGKDKKIRYFLEDYAEMKFNQKYDIIISVIGIHHQNNRGKKLLFNKIYSLLKPGGVFIFGDLVTYKDLKKASLNQALHIHRLVEKSSDQKTLAEWAHHHLALNDLAPIEDQIDWLKTVGFKVDIQLLKINTALIICKK